MNDETTTATSTARTRDVEKAVADVQKTVASAAVVAVDQEIMADNNDDDVMTSATSNADDNKTKISMAQWIWIVSQAAYSLYIIFAGLYFSCDAIDTLRTWAVVWGILVFLANVVSPLRGWKDRPSIGSHLFVGFIALYIWGSSAVFPNWDPDHFTECNNNLFWLCAWSIVSGIGITILIMVVGAILVRRQRHSAGGNQQRCEFAARQ